MTRKQKKMLARIIISAVLLIALIITDKLGYLKWAEGKWYAFLPWLVPYGIIGYDVIKKAVRNICHGDVFDENFLMMIATFGAFGIGEYTEAAAVMLLYQIGELFQGYAVGKSRRSITDLMAIAPDSACVERNGELEEVDPEEVQPEEVIVVKAGERIPLDGIVIEGSSFLDTSSLTGESVPRRIDTGDAAMSGCINTDRVLRIRVTKPYEDSTVSRILELVENASSRKAKVENFITRFAKYYTPVVTIAAVLLALIPPLLFREAWGEWIRRACTFLVISCPCALVISVPLGFFAGIGAASKQGVLVKGSNFLEAISRAGTFVFDKTGTLTKGEFKVQEVLLPEEESAGERLILAMEGPAPVENPGPLSPEERLGLLTNGLLRIAAYSEYYSHHPIAAALRDACPETVDASRIGEVRERSGHGMEAVIDGRKYYVGNEKLMREKNIPFEDHPAVGTMIYVGAEDDSAASAPVYLGAILIADSVKDGAPEGVSALRKYGVKRTVMLTGDRKEAAEMMARIIGIDEVHAELLPEDKVREVEGILEEPGRKDEVVFVGDGLNDAPVLVRADVGVAMGSLGSDAAIEAADIVIMDDDIRKLPKTLKIAQKTMRIVRENIAFALIVKFAVLILGAFGLAGMWLAVFADVGVAVIAILNSMRAMKA